MQLPAAGQRLPRRVSAPAQQAISGTNADIGGSNRADTIILVHTDPKLQKAIILSFPRDLWVDIPGHGPDKINAAFEGGVDGNGPEMMAATIHKLTGLTINHVLYVDLAGFQGVVDTLGGVDMCIPAENVNTPGYVAAEQGSDLLQRGGPHRGPAHRARRGARVPDARRGARRSRSSAPATCPCDAAAPDFYRISRQQQFLRAVINRLLQPAELAKLPGQVQPIMQQPAARRRARTSPTSSTSSGSCGGSARARPSSARSPSIPFVTPDGLDALRMDPSAQQIFQAIREGKPIGDIGVTPAYTPPSPANIAVPVDRSRVGREGRRRRAGAVRQRVRRLARAS